MALNHVINIINFQIFNYLFSICLNYYRNINYLQKESYIKLDEPTLYKIIQFYIIAILHQLMAQLNWPNFHMKTLYKNINIKNNSVVKIIIISVGQFYIHLYSSHENRIVFYSYSIHILLISYEFIPVYFQPNYTIYNHKQKNKTIARPYTLYILDLY